MYKDTADALIMLMPMVGIMLMPSWVLAMWAQVVLKFYCFFIIENSSLVKIRVELEKGLARGG